MPAWLIDASAWVIPVVTAIMLHEVAHGWIAGKFGDPTARLMGRITLNPIRHIDPFGTLLIPGMLIAAGSPMIFGYARPVPVNFARLQPPGLGMRVVALAGPVANVLLAILSALLLHIDTLVTPEHAPWLFQNLYRSLLLNCGLAVFNMLPILPLDGGRVVYSFLSGAPQRWFGRLERRGILILFALLFSLQMMGVELGDLIGLPIFTLVEGIMFITGNSH